MIDVGFFSALLGGLLTFLAPCTLPLIPAYIGFIGGTSQVVEGAKELSTKKGIMFSAFFFVLGFSSVFMLYGMAFGSLSVFLLVYRKLISQIGGFIIIFFGLVMLDFIPFPKLLRRSHHSLPPWVMPGSRIGAFLLGVLFAFGWSPCLGPILGTILLIAGTKSTLFYGAYLLGVYSLGLAIPFLVVAYLYGTSFGYVTALARYAELIKRVGAGLLIVIGVLFIIGQFGIMNTWATEWFGRWYDGFMQYM